jgi:hypothetical protein
MSVHVIAKTHKDVNKDILRIQYNKKEHNRNYPEMVLMGILHSVQADHVLDDIEKDSKYQLKQFNGSLA